MIKSFRLLLLTALSCCCSIANGQEKTVLSAEVYGSKMDKVYFDCIQSPTIKAEFHNNPGEEHHYAFTTTLSPIMILINERTEVLMNAGDSMHVVVRQEGRMSNVVFSGKESTVAANKLRQELRQACRALNYKTDLLSCAALDIKPQKRIEDAKTLLNTVKELTGKYKADTDSRLAAYVSAEQEASSYMSFMEYPKMYSDVRHKPIEEQGIGDYWKLMDGVKLRDDASAMMCPEYASFLMRYYFYIQEKKAVEEGSTYAMPDKLEGMYDELKNFYSGAQRDFTLYTLMCNFIRNGKQIERVIPLFDEYKAKYNENKAYADVLGSLLQ